MAWVGDSRIYLWHASDWYGLWRDHEDLAPLTGPGLLHAAAPKGKEEASGAPTPPRRRHSATQALGVTPPSDLDVRTLQGRCVAGMRFLICSDGLGEQLTDASMRALIGRDELGAQECVDQLIRMALDAGGQDNLTAVLVRIS